MSEGAETAGRASKDSIRAFVCIEVPETIKQRIEKLQQALSKDAAQVSWVKPSSIHLTLKFLGDVRSSRVETIGEALERASSSIHSFEIEAGGAGCFPNARNPRVLWVGFRNLPDSLRQLHAAIEGELAREGFPREPKRFSPHLTIARIRAPKGAARLAEYLIATGFEPERFQAQQIILMRSDLSPKGSLYTPLAKVSLKV